MSFATEEIHQHGMMDGMSRWLQNSINRAIRYTCINYSENNNERFGGGGAAPSLLLHDQHQHDDGMTRLIVNGSSQDNFIAFKFPHAYEPPQAHRMPVYDRK